MTLYDTTLTEAYVRQGVLDLGKQPVHLPTKCPRASICWARMQAQSPKVGSCAGELSAPYIGVRYGEGKLLIVLENLRDYGGFDLGPGAKKGMRFLGDEAKRAFQLGQRKLFRGGSYSGTAVWYQAVTYAACWLAARKALSPKESQLGDLATQTLPLHEAMDLLAIVQHVKCSPDDGRRSNPGDEMWRECGPHLLVHEFQILQPSCIIILGTSKNAPALSQHVFSGLPCDVREQSVTAGKRQLRVRYEERKQSWGNVSLLILPHPASPGGTSSDLVEAVRQVLART